MQCYTTANRTEEVFHGRHPPAVAVVPAAKDVAMHCIASCPSTAAYLLAVEEEEQQHVMAMACYCSYLSMGGPSKVMAYLVCHGI